MKEAESDFKRYEALAQQLIALDPAKPAWQAELAYAQQNLGTLLLEADRFAEARAKLLSAQAQLRQLMGAQPELAAELGNNLGWVARTDERLGHLGHAVGAPRLTPQEIKMAKNTEQHRDIQVTITVNPPDSTHRHHYLALKSHVIGAPDGGHKPHHRYGVLMQQPGFIHFVIDPHHAHGYRFPLTVSVKREPDVLYFFGIEIRDWTPAIANATRPTEHHVIVHNAEIEPRDFHYRIELDNPDPHARPPTLWFDPTIKDQGQ